MRDCLACVLKSWSVNAGEPAAESDIDKQWAHLASRVAVLLWAGANVKNPTKPSGYNLGFSMKPVIHLHFNTTEDPQPQFVPLV